MHTVTAAARVARAAVGAAAQVAGAVGVLSGATFGRQFFSCSQPSQCMVTTMQAMSDSTGGAWHPSRGAIYPTIAQVEDEGLVTTREEGGRRLVTLTSEGGAQLEERSARLGDPFADFADAPNRPDLRDPVAPAACCRASDQDRRRRHTARGRRERPRAGAAVAVFDLGRGGRGCWRVSEGCAPRWCLRALHS